jgi:Tfp pilus assembly protein FimT
MIRLKGTSFIELLAGIAIVGLLVGINSPDLRQIFVKSRIDTDARLILRHLQKTREVAVLSGQEMIFCGVDAEQNCVRDDIKRFVSFYDHNKNRKVDSDEMVVSELQLNFPGHAYLRASGAHYMRYFNDGSANPYGSVFLCPSSNNPTMIRRITNQMAGRPYLARTLADGATGAPPIHCDA